MEVRPEGIATPSHTRNTDTRFAQQRIINGDTERSLGGELRKHMVTDNGEDLKHGQPMLGEETIAGGPVEEL